MVCAPVRSIIPSLKLKDYLSVQAHKPCSISHLFLNNPPQYPLLSGAQLVCPLACMYECTGRAFALPLGQIVQN